MKRIVILVAILGLMLSAVAVQAKPVVVEDELTEYIYPGIDIYANCEAFYVYIEAWEDREIKLKVDGQIIASGTYDPYFSWADAWPQDRKNHQIMLWTNDSFEGRNKYQWKLGCG